MQRSTRAQASAAFLAQGCASDAISGGRRAPTAVSIDASLSGAPDKTPE